MLQWTLVSTLVAAVCTHWILIVRDSTGRWKRETASLQKSDIPLRGIESDSQGSHSLYGEKLTPG